MRQLQNQQRCFCKEFVITDEDAQHAKDAVVLMELRLSVLDTATLLNQQQMFMEDDHVYAITPLARLVLQNYWQESLPLALITKARHVFTHPEAYKSVERGHALEGFILNTLMRISPFQIPLQLCVVKEPEPDIYEVEWKNCSPLQLSSYKICHFPTNKPPPKEYFSREVLIFIPYNSNYPDLDFAIWDGITRKIWAFQVTVDNPITDHSNKIHVIRENTTISHSSQWCENIGISQKEFNFCWIGTNKNINARPEQYNEHYFATLRDNDWIDNFRVLQEWVD